MADWDHAHCLPYFKRIETCLAAAPDDPYRGHDGPLVLERGPATSPLFDAFFEAVQQAGLRADRRRQRLPAGGLRAVRPQHPPRPAALAPRAPTCTRPCAGPNLDVRTLGARDRRHVRGQARDRRRVPHRRRGRITSRRARSSSAAARSTRRSCSSCRASALPRAARARDRRRRRPARRRREPPGPSRGLRPARLPQPVSMAPYSRCSGAPVDRVRVAASAPARARPTTSRPAASSAATRTSPTRT